MRVTNQMMVNNVIQYIDDIKNKINTTQEQIASTKKFQTPSDDPTTSSMCLQLKSSLSISEGYQNTANTISDWMSTTDFSLEQLSDIATDAYNIVLSGLNDTVDADERKSSLATELNEMINKAVDIGNSSFQGSYIFAGVRVDQPAFVMSDENTITYNGISKEMVRSIGQNSKVTMNIDGNETIKPLIQALIDARNYLTNNDTSNLPGSLDSLKTALETLTASRTENGTRMRQIENSISNMEKADIAIRSILSEKEDTSITEAYSQLASQESTYQAVLEVGSRTLSALNLFDYLN
jgi:flagellar hook-associated protein 3 FlgL